MQTDVRIERARAIHARVLAALSDHRRSEHALAVLLAEMEEEGHLRALGYATLGEYARAVLDLAPGVAGELARTGRRLRRLPVTAGAFEAGEVGWSKVREIARVATPETEAAWLEWSEGRTCRTVEDAVSRSHVGDAPPADDAPRPGPARCRVYFEMEAGDAKVLRDMLLVLRQRAGVSRDEVNDGALLADLARRIIEEQPADGSPTGEGATGEAYRIVLEICPACHAAKGVDAEVSDTVVSEACCDAEIVDVRPGPAQGHASRVVPPALRRLVLHRDRWRCTVPGCQNGMWLHLHHDKPFALGGATSLGNLRTLCGTHHRLVHAGLLAIERLPDGRTLFVHGDGRRSIGPGLAPAEVPRGPPGPGQPADAAPPPA